MNWAFSLFQRSRTGGPRLGCIGQINFYRAEQGIEIGTQVAEAIATLSPIAASVSAPAK